MPNSADSQDMGYQPKVEGFSYKNPVNYPSTDNSETKQSLNPLSGNKNNKPQMNIFLSLLAELFGLFLIFFIFLSILNYFNIISLKNISPQIFSWLPQMSSKTQEKTTSNISINSIPLAEDTKKIGKFLQYPLPSGTGYILSSQYPTIVAVEKDTKNNLVWVAASFDEAQLTSSSSAITINDVNSMYYTFKGLTIWYAIDNHTKISKKWLEESKPNITYATGVDYAIQHIATGDMLFQITSQPDGGTKAQPNLNGETLKLIKNATGKENVRDNKSFRLYADQVVLP